MNLTKREEFAARAMQGIMANKNTCPPLADVHMRNIAEDATGIADALIEHLEETAEPLPCTIFMPIDNSTSSECKYCGKSQLEHNFTSI